MLNNYTSKEVYAYTFLHEISHSIGAIDHYHDTYYDEEGKEHCLNNEICSEYGKNKRDARCIMGYGRYGTEPHLNHLFCEPCKQEINAHIRNHH